MSEDIQVKTANELAEDRTNLAYERTALANDRTLMAWVRTATSLISFGFTIYKFFQELVKTDHIDVQHRLLSPRHVGMMLIIIGFLGLFLGLLQYRNDMKRLKVSSKDLPRSFTPLIAILILLLGLILFLAALLRQ
ncbi:MAG TPA: DUF202 domain-containing protein [Ignavibacteria bacterium]|nr:DUF202 domain-containing protein [Ignavibacteria bacterium]HRJ99423.1 DUF202 domain-containing protein [Ignavibacteria bacterium]